MQGDHAREKCGRRYRVTPPRLPRRRPPPVLCLCFADGANTWTPLAVFLLRYQRPPRTGRGHDVVGTPFRLSEDRGSSFGGSWFASLALITCQVKLSATKHDCQ